MTACYSMLINTACEPPPQIANGTADGPAKPAVGTIVRYTCNEGFFPHGENYRELETKCLKSQTYSKYSDQLASCYLIS